MTDRAAELTDVTLYSGFAVRRADAPYCSPEYKDTFLVNNLFVANNIRRWLAQGYRQSTPAFLGEIPGLFRDGTLPVDVAILNLSRPNEEGYCSFGVSADSGRFGRGMRQDGHRAGQHGHAVLLRRRRDPPRASPRPSRSTTRWSKCPRRPHRHRTQDRQPHRRTDPRRATLQIGVGGIPNAVLAALTGHDTSGCIPRR